jgi:hypothetical protein
MNWRGAAQEMGNVAGQVPEISKHESTTRSARPQTLDGRGRLYVFPSATVAAGASMIPESGSAAAAPKSRFRAHLAVELAIGIILWLLWFTWRLLH